MPERMNAVERIEAAIQKLEEIKAVAYPAHAKFIHEYTRSAFSDDALTLALTIDAQLAILRGARADVNVYGGHPATLPGASYLADALLGGPDA